MNWLVLVQNIDQITYNVLNDKMTEISLTPPALCSVAQHIFVVVNGFWTNFKVICVKQWAHNERLIRFGTSVSVFAHSHTPLGLLPSLPSSSQKPTFCLINFYWFSGREEARRKIVLNYSISNTMISHPSMKWFFFVENNTLNAEKN